MAGIRSLEQMLETAKKERVKGRDLRNPNIVLLPQEVIDLQQELENHLDLRIAYQGLGTNMLATLESLCAEVGIAVDGMYSEKDIYKLCQVLTDKLRERRGSLIVRRV